MKKLQETEILNDFYNLILNPEVSEKERQLLLRHKEQLENGKKFERAIQDLEKEIRHLSLQNLSSHQSLSQPLSDFYKKIYAMGEFKNNLGRGLMSYGIVR